MITQTTTATAQLTTPTAQPSKAQQKILREYKVPPSRSHCLEEGSKFPTYNDLPWGSSTYYGAKCLVVGNDGGKPPQTYFYPSTEPTDLANPLAWCVYGTVLFGQDVDGYYIKALKTRRDAIWWLRRRVERGVPVVCSDSNPTYLRFGEEGIWLDPSRLAKNKPVGRLLDKFGLGILYEFLGDIHKEFLGALLDAERSQEWILKRYDVTFGMGDNPMIALVPKGRTESVSRWKLRLKNGGLRYITNEPYYILYRAFPQLPWDLLGKGRQCWLAECRPEISVRYWEEGCPDDDGHYRAQVDCSGLNGWDSATTAKVSLGTISNSVMLLKPKLEKLLSVAVSLTAVPHDRPASEVYICGVLKDSHPGWVNSCYGSVLSLRPHHTETFIFEVRDDLAKGLYRNIVAARVTRGEVSKWGREWDHVSFSAPVPESVGFCYEFDEALQSFVRV